MRRTIPLILFALSLLTAGCELTEALQNAEIPSLAHKNTALVTSPNTTQVLAYFCPGTFGSTACGIAGLSAVPAKEDMRFDFELTFQIDNPNSIAIPTLSMLLATTLFEAAEAEELGAVCVSFCAVDDPNCTGQSAEDACKAEEGQQDIASFEDFAAAASKKFLDVVQGTADSPYADNTRIKTIPANGSADVKVVFTFDIDQMTDTLLKVSGLYVDNFINGATDTKINIPYSMNGTVWVDLPFNTGRYGLGFGPVNSAWEL